jgi:LAS superfamily LD-carboxypeptidase LdcB
VGSCKGGDVSGYSNGHIPESALCPLWGAPGHRLRADAAAAFNRMSKAYAAHFGAPICVTDSYRSYAQQERVYAEKPGLAARPGTSNHGWGLATDLCGGIETDGTATNTWLRQNAGRFAWFHPSWGDPGGSGPYEPWHWEYAGGQ